MTQYVGRALMRGTALSLLSLVLGACGSAAAADAPVGAATESAAVSTPPAAASAGPHRAANEVSIENFSFSPAALTVTAGTTVRWINHDDLPHTVMSSAKRFGSGALDTDDNFSYRFTARGTYAYYCAIHPTMTGTIVVK